MKLPGERTASGRIAEQKAFVPFQVPRVPGLSAARKICRRSTGEDARFQKLACDLPGRLRLPEPHCDIKGFRY